ncbi:NUDIX hydrolase [Streptacidiphilus fuscans]|uniref:NUDIX domain-containing protein n=1 Tax=Streptacidiphilus fuscans TaxID=2789292 RepID=A0A931B6P5_9ACTN|nr:NUDIX domain-containing protein [Streptacidiphilus fuscans]MBF9069991.1 NUDIX domain-containing protein [Streptacidiphilus fuscans]
MPVPEFVRELRAHIGHGPLWMSGVTAVILDGEGRVLLTHRSDNRRWALVAGIVEPGEEPADAAVREAWEEVGLRILPERLAGVGVDPPAVYPNGDQVQYLNLTFRCRVLSGEARVNDDESLAVGWFAVDALPDDLGAHQRRHLAWALADEERAQFSLTASTPGAADDHDAGSGA